MSAQASGRRTQPGAERANRHQTQAKAPRWRLHGRTQACCARAQYYFETIFPRIPKPVQDDFVSKLTSMGLPSRAVGNAGQGGADRRGIEEANRRPASVKASLCGLQAFLGALQGSGLDASYEVPCRRLITGCSLGTRSNGPVSLYDCWIKTHHTAFVQL